MKTILGADDAARNIDEIRDAYILDTETYGEDSTRKVICSLSTEEVGEIEAALSGLERKISAFKGDLRDFFHQSRRKEVI